MTGPSLPLLATDEDLLGVLSHASDEDLAPLVHYITDGGTGRVSSELEMTAVYKAHQPAHHHYYKEIASEIQTFGGNTFANIVRGTGVPYREVLIDVAGKVKANFNPKQDTATIELAVLMKVLSDAWEKMSAEERREFLETVGLRNFSVNSAIPIAAVQAAIAASGFVAYQVAVIIANAVARTIIGRGLTFAGNAALTRTIGVLAGPIGWAITAVWAAIDLAGPGSRVTIPCVVHVAYLRQKQLLCTCRNGHANGGGVRFCGECGAALEP